MPLNLIRDAWIPVATRSGQTRTIRPDQIAEPDVLAPDWPRADLNIACLELLIGLVYLADPPQDAVDWRARRADPDRLRAKMAPLATAFDLGGDGPRFCQDLEKLADKANPPDMLFIDSAGGSTAKKNADLMVRRGRYPALEAGLAAMALYTLQAHAPSGGAGNRTSMRGGGPLVTLVDPGGRRAAGEPATELWDLLWANVPYGAAQGPEVLPWMRATRTSDTGKLPTVPPPGNATPAEVFFGMPRRLRLVFDGDLVTGVIQRPWGTNYAGWRHPLTPYYQIKAGTDLLPKHPRAGSFGYRNWLGVLIEAGPGALGQQAGTIVTYGGRVRDTRGASVIIAGWAMDNMKPRDFLLSRQPLVRLQGHAELLLRGFIEAAEVFGQALRGALKPVLGEGTALEAAREEFFLRTEPPFAQAARAVEAGQGDAAGQWRKAMHDEALTIFDAAAMPGLDQRETDMIARIVDQRGWLLATLNGRSKQGRTAFGLLELPIPEQKKKVKA